jgi:hypothetical protein
MAVPHAQPGEVVDVRPLGPALASSQTATLLRAGQVEVRRLVVPARKDVDMTAIMKTREERWQELKRLAATPDGTDKLYAILTGNFIPFQKLPIGTLMIEAILDHEYPEGK